ncbi:hypothetical protein [Nocardia cyriacigeorgica]|uniref:hypothetical protein n=1 Tax=Nocardia cyriacigeorgica TaxID=135487 RepID=UPI001E65607A|nr:hypothetical protein [Nocardia cyriacigeorgica]
MAVDVLGAGPIIRGHHEPGIFLRLCGSVLGAFDDALERQGVDYFVADRRIVGFADGVLGLRQVAFHQVETVGDHLEAGCDRRERGCECASAFDCGGAGLAIPVGGDVFFDAFGECRDRIARVPGEVSPTIGLCIDRSGVDVFYCVVDLLMRHRFEGVFYGDDATSELITTVLAEQAGPLGINYCSVGIPLCLLIIDSLLIIAFVLVGFAETQGLADLLASPIGDVADLVHPLRKVEPHYCAPVFPSAPAVD